MAYFETNLSGVTFAVVRTPQLASAEPRGKAKVVIDAGNEFAKHAYGALPVEWLGIPVGFIPDGKAPDDAEAGPEDVAKWYVHEAIGAMLLAGKDVSCTVVDVGYLDGEEWHRKPGVGQLAAVTVGLATDSAPHVTRASASSGPTDLDPSISMTDFSDAGERMESWNEPGVVVAFEEREHVYRYQENVLTSATDLTDKCVKPFPIDFIAPKSAKKYGISEAEVREMWSRNGDVASKFGDAIHLALHNYCCFREKCGEKALPNHPFLREIVLSFPWQHDLEEYSEVLVTCVGRGICGTSDRLVVDKQGVVHVADLKVKFGVEATSSKDKNLLIPEAPSNKLGLAQVQMSVYGEMLELSGKTVGDTVTAHVWGDKQQWEAFEMPRIRGVLDRLNAQGQP